VLGVGLLACQPLARRQYEREVAALEVELGAYRSQLQVQEQHVAVLNAQEQRQMALKREAENELYRTQRLLVESWRGNAETLTEQSRAAGVPNDLLNVLRATQSSLGQETREQLFAHAMKANDLRALTRAVVGFETHAEVTEPQPPVRTRALAPACSEEHQAYTCSPFQGAATVALLCSPSEGGEAWLIASHRGVALGWSFELPLGSEIRLARLYSHSALGPRLAVFAVDETGATPIRWLWLSSLLDGRATRQASLPIDLRGHHGEIAYVDIDGDGEPDILHAFEGRLTAMLPKPGEPTVELWERDRVCVALARLPQNAAGITLAPFEACCRRRGRSGVRLEATLREAPG
jgi:hypothetical protein